MVFGGAISLASLLCRNGFTPLFRSEPGYRTQYAAGCVILQTFVRDPSIARGSMTKATAPEPSLACERCLKPTALCMCDRLTPLKSNIDLLILQHPQEQDRELGTAKLLALSFPKRTKLVVGLSWRSLAHALGQETNRAHWGRHVSWPVAASAHP